MSQLFIGVKRIIAVDSSEFAYAELDVDAHSMLVAQGNVGKSSLINAIRLFFLPECSFGHQERNFGFSDSHGEMYKSEETFQHYFPSKHSFLILEYEKRLFDGPHCCQIISASGSGRLKIERMFTQLPYAQLQHLFWTEGDDEYGIGQRNEQLSKKTVYDYIQKHDKTWQLAKDEHKVASIIYEKALHNSTYTLFPLSEQTPQNINALRALIKLLFVATGKNKTPFISAVANIIETGKKSSQDHLSFDISEFKQKHLQLKQQETQLNNIINLETDYQKIIQSRTKFLTYLSMLSDVEPGIAWLETGTAEMQAQLQLFADKQQSAQSAYFDAKQTLDELVSTVKQDKRSLVEKQKELTSCQTILNNITKLKTEFPGQSLTYIHSALSDELYNVRTRLKVKQGEADRAVEIAKIDNKLAHFLQQLKRARYNAENTELALANQLSTEQLYWLHSINPTLAAANPGTRLNKQEKASIAQFADLFEDAASHYQFFDSQVERVAFIPQDLDALIDKLETEIHALEKNKADLTIEDPDPLHTEHSVSQLKKQISVLELDLEALDNAEYMQRRYDILHQEILALKSKETEQAQHVESCTTKKKKLEDKRDAATQAHLSCQDNIRTHQSLLKQLNSFRVLHQTWLAIVPKGNEFDGYINAESLELFNTSASHLGQYQSQMLQQIRGFLDKGIITDKHGITGEVPFWPEISAAIDDISEVYGNLDTQRTLLHRQIEEHNQTIGTKKAIIVQNYDLIKQFEQQINRDFSGITINNVAAVEFKVGINQQFSALVHELNETNLFNQQLPSDDFFARLVAFAERFFKGSDTFNLTMEKVIESFEPRVQLHNKATKEDKKQSNSTAALIKIKLVQILLKRLLAHDCETSLPVVYDEIANIDIGQFDWWLDDLAASGFKLMAAGTHSTSAELQAKIGRRHVMDAMHTNKPYHQERARVYWAGAETFSDELTEQTQWL